MPYDGISLFCDEKIRLLLECSKAANDYSDAVTIMSADARISTLEEFQRAKQTAERCRLSLRQTYYALDQHIAKHDCVGSEI